jgi:predicted nucleotidyltransferase
MNRDRALNILRGLRAPLAARGIAHAAIFGSVARSKENALSDIDVFVTPAEGARPDLFDLGGIQSILEEAFGSEVDVVVSPVRNGEIRAAIARDRADAF